MHLDSTVGTLQFHVYSSLSERLSPSNVVMVMKEGETSVTDPFQSTRHESPISSRYRKCVTNIFIVLFCEISLLDNANKDEIDTLDNDFKI